MKVIICGAGQVGFGIARQLSAEDNHVTVVDQSAELISHVTERLDVQGIIGHGSHPEVLEQAGARDADMLIAVTYFDEVNMVAAQVAHSIFSVPLKIARVRAQSYLSPLWSDLFSRDHMPIDVVISPELEVASTILRRLDVPGAFETADFADRRVQVVGVHLDENCPIVNTQLKQLTELFPDLNAIVVGISRDEKLYVPRSTDQMLVGDDIYLSVEATHVERTLDIFGHEEREARRVVILGGGNIGLYLAQQLEASAARINLKIIERDKERAEFVADQLERTVVLHGDGLNQDLMREAGIGEAETIIALTNQDQVNVLACVLAKKEGCQRALCLVNDNSYTGLSGSLGIDAFIDPRAKTVSTILRHVRRGRIRDLYSIENGAAEVIEAEALETSPLAGKPLKEADLPDGIMIGAIVRDDEVIIPRGNTVVETHDRVILFAQRSAVHKVEKLFRVSLEYF
ncbi:MAG: Trk system potassium transporter TrkA [Alphaproteobacteria bacterium]|nr:MAG: Trk system potassium transporter TrkA [Alphaproteobacteria bacterium]